MLKGFTQTVIIGFVSLLVTVLFWASQFGVTGIKNLMAITGLTFLGSLLPLITTAFLICVVKFSIRRYNEFKSRK